MIFPVVVFNPNHTSSCYGGVVVERDHIRTPHGRLTPPHDLPKTESLLAFPDCTCFSSQTGNYVQALLFLDLVYSRPFLAPLAFCRAEGVHVGLSCIFLHIPQVLQPPPSHPQVFCRVRMPNGQWPEWQG
jgi:hypothetical protein